MAIDMGADDEYLTVDNAGADAGEERQYDEQDEDFEGEEQKQHPADLLKSYIDQPNLAEKLTKEQLNKIGQEVVRGYDIDKNSRSDWEKQTDTAMDLAMQVTEEKSWPWPKAANVKYPLITTAAIQFSARAYPAIVKGADVVKGEVIGPDPEGKKKERAERIGHHMSYQLLNEMEEWDEDVDKLLLRMSIVGCEFRKTYFDSSLARNVSELCAAKHVVYNHATPFRKLRRITHEIFPFKNEVIENIRAGLWEEIELGLPEGEDNDEDGSFEFLEQHCWYDLDDDGYKEPYIVTVRKESSEVVRIVARYDEDGIYLNPKGQISKILPVGYFTKFAFMPNPDGGSYDVGLGILLNPINETINTLLNQMLDAGTLQNVGGGFVGNGLRMKGGALKVAPGQFIPVDNKGGAIRDNIYHMEHKGPSTVLFQLLGMLIEAGKDISSVKDILTGDQQVNQTATTTLALIEQGQKVFSAIYKRVHRSLKDEFRKLYRLNKLYMQPEEYYQYLDKSEPVYIEDYQGDATDVCPVSDPNLVSDAQQLAQAEALMKFIDDPLVKQDQIRLRYFRAIKVENPESLLQEQQPQQQDPKVTEMIGKLEILEKTAKADIDKKMAEIDQIIAKTADTHAAAVLKLAQAEALELGPQMDIYMAQFKAMLDTASQQGKPDGQGTVPGMEKPPANPEVPPVPEGQATELDGGLGGGGLPEPIPGAGGAPELGGDGAGAVPPGPGGA